MEEKKERNVFEKVYDFDNLYRAWLEVRRVSAWKERTQRYEEDILSNIFRLGEALKAGTARLGDFRTFVIKERGKLRLIHSYDIDTRIAVRSFIDNVLLPKVLPKLIYDNSASIKGKGVDFHRRRLVAHLQRFYRKHGNGGYVLTMDFSKFFDNIDHAQLKAMFAKVLGDDECSAFASMLVDKGTTDISCLTEDERLYLEDHPFDSVSFHSKMDASKCNGSVLLHRGVPIGGQLSQIAGVFYPSDIDSCVKTVKGERHYARYMDDIYVIHQSKEHLRALLDEIRAMCKAKGIFINERKTQITPIWRPFTILKVQYRVTADGDIVRSPCKDTFKRERRAIHRFAKDIDAGRRSKADVCGSYRSWRGNFSRFDCLKSIRSVDGYFERHIGERPWETKATD